MSTSSLKGAPKLKFDSDKEDYYDVVGFYQLPQRVMDKINLKLKDSSAQIRVMTVLIGTKENFGVSANWLSARTSISRSNLYDTINKLIEKGFLSRDEKEGTLIVNYKKIME